MSVMVTEWSPVQLPTHGKGGGVGVTVVPAACAPPRPLRLRVTPVRTPAVAAVPALALAADAPLHDVLRPAYEINSVPIRANPPVGEKIAVSETGIQVSVAAIALERTVLGSGVGVAVGGEVAVTVAVTVRVRVGVLVGI